MEFSVKLLEYIYNLRNKESFDMNKLYEIDPYDDVEISTQDIPIIINICTEKDLLPL